MAFYLVGGCRLGARAVFQDLVLEAAGQLDDTCLVAVDVQEFLARFLVDLEPFLLEFHEIVVDYLFCLVVGDGWLVARQDIGQTLDEILHLEVLDARVLKIIADAQAKRVTYFIHLVLFFCFDYK